jgi:membrane protease YdiL (CAAX protease family)
MNAGDRGQIHVEERSSREARSNSDRFFFLGWLMGWRRWALASSDPWVEGTGHPWRFVLWITAEQFVVGMLVLRLLQTAFPSLPSRRDLGDNFVVDFINVVVAAPLVETLLFQFLPIAILRHLRVRFWWQVLASAAIFALAHFTVNIQTGIVAGVFGGLYLGFTFAWWARWSKRRAYWTTALSHALGNLMAILTALAFGAYPSDQTLEKRCLEYTAPPMRVVFDQSAAALSTLPAADPQFHVSSFTQGVFFTPSQWSEIFRWRPLYDGVAFMHERYTPSGHHALVVILVRPDSAAVMQFKSIVDRTLSGQIPASSLTGGSCLTLRDFSPPLRIYAGQPDLSDRSRFTISFQSNAQSHLIDGQLADDDKVVLRLR